MTHLGDAKQWIAAGVRSNRLLAPSFRRLRARQLIQGGVGSEYVWAHRLAQTGSIAVDVGANVGQVTAILANAVGRTGIVVALEPSPALQDALLLGVHGLPVIVLPYALGAESGSRELLVPLGADGDARWQLGSIVKTLDEQSSRSFKVASVTLDSLRPLFWKRISVIKIDVEGAELEVLAGGIQTLREHRPFVILEIEPRHQPSGQSVTDVYDIIEDIGYSLKAITRQGLKAVARDFWDESERPESPGAPKLPTNFVAEPRP